MKSWTTGAFAGLMLTTALTACNSSESTTTAPEAAAPVCDRACLIKLTDNYVAALVKHSADGAHLSNDVTIVENLKHIGTDAGLWKDLTAGPTQFQVHVPDEANETAGWLGMVERDGKPTMVAIRLKLDPRGSIVEAEHLYAEVGKPQQANTQAVRAGLVSEVPPASRKTHDELIRIGASYYDALDDNDGTKMPFAADCERHENGMITAGPNSGPGPNGPRPHPVARDCAGQLSSGTFQYIATIGNRRVFAADPQTGLVMGLSQFHHPMDFAAYPVKAADGTVTQTRRDEGFFKTMQPFDLPAAHIFKVGADGKVHEIEAMGFLAPLNSPSGWDK